MKSIGFFAELGYPDGPSLQDAIGKCPGSQRDEIADYLDAGSALVVSSSWVDDIVDPAATRVARSAVYTDGRFVWPHVLGYYVRNYGVDVPPELARRARGNHVPDKLSKAELMAILNRLASVDPTESGVG